MVDATAAVAAAAERNKDRSSVQFAHYNDDDAILAKSTIDLADKVDDGIENAACLAFREERDCDMIQRYFDGAAYRTRTCDPRITKASDAPDLL